jgi:hypothetical protein
MHASTQTPIPATPPRDTLRTAHLLSRISGHTAAPVYDNGAWRYRFEISPEDAGAVISAADNPAALVSLMAPLLERYRGSAR